MEKIGIDSTEAIRERAKIFQDWGKLTITLFKNSFKSIAFLKTHLLYFIFSLKVREILA